MPSNTATSETGALPIFYWSEKPYLDGDSSIDDIITQLDLLEYRLMRAFAGGLDEVAAKMGADAQLTDAYENVTHATRESTVGYVVTELNPSDTNAIAVLAQARAETLNPGHVDYGVVTAGEDEIAIIVQAMTDYSLHLNLRDGSAEPFLLNAMASNTALAQKAIEAIIRRYFT